MPMLAPAQLIEHLTDAFEQGNDELPGPARRPSPSAYRCSRSRSNTSAAAPLRSLSMRSRSIASAP